MIPPKTTQDRDRMEADYRAGVKSLEQIGQEHGVTKGRVSQIAKQLGWVRDLAPKIKARADAKVNAAAAKAALNDRELNDPAKQSSRRLAESSVVEANAELQYQVRLSQRKDITRARNVGMALLSELELQAGPENVDLLSKLGELMANPDDKGVDKLNEIYHKVISLPGRMKTAKDMAETLKTLVALEREAFGIDARASTTENPLAALLAQLGGRSTTMPVAQDPDHA